MEILIKNKLGQWDLVKAAGHNYRHSDVTSSSGKFNTQPGDKVFEFSGAHSSSSSNPQGDAMKYVKAIDRHMSLYGYKKIDSDDNSDSSDHLSWSHYRPNK